MLKKEKNNNKKGKKSQLLIVGSLLILIGISVIGIKIFLDVRADNLEDIALVEFYEEQEEDTLDYQIDGSEIYRVYYKNSEPVYELITEMGFAHVFPPSGYSYYVARVYAFNALGEKVYSDFSDYTPVVRTPIISVSEVLDGKVTVSIDNINDYRKDSGITFTLYGLVDSTNEEVELGNIIYQGDQELVFEIEVTENMQVYASASINDWIHSTSDQAIRAYSYKSNGVDIIA